MSGVVKVFVVLRLLFDKLFSTSSSSSIFLHQGTTAKHSTPIKCELAGSYKSFQQVWVNSVWLVLPVHNIINLLSKQVVWLRQLHTYLLNGKQRWWCVIAPEVHPQLFCLTATEPEMILFTLSESSALLPSLNFCNLSLQSCQSISEGSVTISLMRTANKSSDRTVLFGILRCLLHS